MAAEALRNLCLLGPALTLERQVLSHILLVASKPLTTSDRLRGAAMEALSYLTRRVSADKKAYILPSVHNELVQWLVEARFVSDNSGLGLKPNPQSTNTAAKDLRN